MQALDLIKRAETHAGGPAAVARTLGVPTSHLSNWKAGDRTCPPDMRARLAALAGLDPMAELVEGLAEGLSDERRAGLLDALQWRRRSLPNRLREVLTRLRKSITHPDPTARNLAKPTAPQGCQACGPAEQPA